MSRVNWNSLRLYESLASLPWPRSYAGKVLGLCALGMNVPMVAMALLWTPAKGLAAGQVSLLGIGFGAVVGTLATLAGLRLLLAPVMRAGQALDAHAAGRSVPQLPRRYPDEAGRLLAQVQTTLERLDHAISEQERLAQTDPLTGIGNRRWMLDRAKESLARARRMEEPLSVLMIDIDFFKRINDTYGHPAGDEVLRNVSRRISRRIRAYDYLARMGGEEFAVILPGTSPESAREVAARLHACVAEIDLDSINHSPVTISIGVAGREGYDIAFDAILARADEALYDAKRNGRNRTELWRDRNVEQAAAVDPAAEAS